MKEFKTKIWRTGDSMALIVPAWIRKAFDVEVGDEVIVKLEKVNDIVSKPHSPYNVALEGISLSSRGIVAAV